MAFSACSDESSAKIMFCSILPSVELGGEILAELLVSTPEAITTLILVRWNDSG